MSSETYEEEYDASPLVDNIMEEAEDDMRKEHQAHEREQQRQGMLLSGDTLTLDIEEQEKYVMEGVRMFLSNDFDGAERHCMAGFENHGDPICMIVVTCIAVVRALCTFRHEDIELVKEYSLKAYYAADALLPKESVGSKLVRFVTRRTREQLSMIQLRAIVAKSEASSLRALALLLGESVVGLIKASMAARLSYNLLTSLDAHPQRASMVPAVSEGVSLGLGLNNLLLSALPPRLLKLVSFFGFPHDRKKGEELILQVIDGCGNRSPTAYMIALILYGILPSFASVLVEPCLPKALALCKKYLDGYPESVLLTWLIGRVYRMQRDVKKSTQFFEKSIESVKDRGPFTVLGNFAWYDKAWSHCCMFEWEAAIACFETLLDKSSWSPAFYTFAAGACFEALGRWDEALARYRLAPSLINRRIMGRTISVEQYIQDRVKELTPAQSAPSVVDTSTDSEASQGCCMPIWELMYLFALFGQVPHDKLKDMVSTLETYIEGSSTLKSTWKIHTPITELLLSRANFEIKNVSVAQKHLENVLESVDGVAQQQDESYPGWVLPHALYEATSQGHLRGDAESGSQYAKKLNGYLQQKKDFNFEFMLQLRCHLSVDSFNTEIS